MTKSSAAWIALIFMISSVSAADVPYTFDESQPDITTYSSEELEHVRASTPELEDVPSISKLSDDDTIEFSVTGGGVTIGNEKIITLRELKGIFNTRVEPENPTVRREALTLTAEHPGDLTIEQICSIYEFLKWGDRTKASWSYVRDPRGVDYYNYANETLAIGMDTGCSGVGDCDDFAILMSALIESVGGTTRIVLAYNESGGGHAYAEVYLGRIDSANGSVDDVVQWLMQTYNVSKVYTHIDSDTKDVWLNLDWGDGPTGHSNPGGQLYKGDKHVVVAIRDEFYKTPVGVDNFVAKPPTNSPPELIDLISDKISPQSAGSTIEFTAHASDSDRDTIYYKFWLKGPLPNEELKLMQDWGTKNFWDWMPSQDGNYEINVWIRDGKHAASDSCDSSMVADFTISPASGTNRPPVVTLLRTGVGTNVVTFYAVATDPESDPIYYKFYVKGPSTGYTWEAVEDWRTENEVRWLTWEQGNYMVQVWVRDGLHAGPDSYDSIKTGEFAVTKQPSVSNDEEWAARGSGIKGRPACPDC